MTLFPSKPDKYVPIEKPPSPMKQKTQVYAQEGSKLKRAAKKRKGYMATAMTRPGQLGRLNIEKQKALGE